MGTYGRQVLDVKTGHPVQVTADGSPVWHPVGITVDWGEVDPVADDPVVLADGLVIPVGQKYLRYGQVLVKDGDKYVPFDEHTLVRGEVVILNATVLEKGVAPGVTTPASDHPAVIEGGLCWKARIIANDDTASLEDGPLFSDLEAALPLLRYVE